MKINVLYNPRSGSAQQPKQLRQLFERQGIRVQGFYTLDGDKSLPVTDNSIIAVIGGDGTISAVADRLKGSRVILAPLPGGTLNHFTKDLGIPQQLEEAVARLKNARVRQIDVGTVNGKVFINNSSIGLYPSSLRERRRFEHRIGKWPAVFVAAVRAFFRLPGYEVTINKKTFHTPFVFIGNNDYRIDSLGVAVRTRLDQGVLSVFMAKRTSRLLLLKIAVMALVGRAHLIDEFETQITSEVVIATARKHPAVSRDGEVWRMKSPLTYRSEPASLRILG